MSGAVLALLGHRAGEPAASVRALVERARSLASAADAELAGLALCGTDEAGAVASAFAASGVDRLYLAADARLAPYLPELHARATAASVSRLSPRLLVCAHDFEGSEVAPWVAGALELPLLSNCVDLRVEAGDLVAERLAFAGAWQLRLRLPWNGAAIATLAAASAAEKGAPAARAPVEPLALELPAPRSASLGWSAASGDVDLARADVVVGIGRGIGDAARLGVVEELAAALGGIVGCSRPLVDLAWLPHARQIGVSGHAIRPKVYLACGISGAAQHLAGIGEAQTVVAINRDPAAPIFRVAHHGVVGDLFEIVPALTAELRRRAASAP